MIHIFEIAAKLIIGTVLIYLVFSTLYFFVFALAGKFKNYQGKSSSSRFNKIAVFIPAYKEDKVIKSVAHDALKQNYPKDLFEIIIVADSFAKTTLDYLKSIPIKLIEVNFEKSTKTNAMRKAMQLISDSYDIAVILDADNVMESNFLSKINKSYNEGNQIIQGHRVAKNLNNSIAILDALSEEINNNIFRKGHVNLGLSSALIGSGMAFNYDKLKEYLESMEAVGGFDKELELMLIRDNYKISYLDKAYVYDEKVQHKEVIINQRRRWLSAQFIYLKRFWKEAIIAFIMKGKVDFLDKVVQMALPPRILFIGILFIVTSLLLLTQFFNLIDGSYVQNITYILSSLFVLGITSILISIPGYLYNKKTLVALLYVPLGFYYMILSLLKIKGANKNFIHTTHSN